MHYGWLHFSLANDLKMQLQEISKTADYLKIMSDLVALVAQATPDVYAEALWKSICLSLAHVIEHDLMPFLAIAGLGHLSKTL